VIARRGRLGGPATWLLAAALAASGTARNAAAQSARGTFFQSDSVLAVTLRTDLRTLLRDRDTVNSEWRAATLTYVGPDSAVTVPLRVRTRGLYRLKNCEFPPIRLRFVQNEVRGTLWDDLRRPKLVTHCENQDNYEQNLLQEYAIYRVFRLFTPVSFGARLLRVTYEDSAGGARPVTRYGIVTEDPERLAERLGGTLVDSAGIRINRLQQSNAVLLSVFQFFIANTDWAMAFLHNIALVRMADGLHGVPFDFDWTGVINARYARPNPVTHLSSVRVRLYRGLCLPQDRFEPVLARFEALRDSIAAVYRAVPGLEPSVVERTLRYYDEFYRAIADRTRFFRREIEPNCGA
jgi:hypothetical protein